MEIITKNATETTELGKKIGTQLKGGEVIALTGEMGAGKTTFVQGLAKGLGIVDRVNSPTFIIMRQYTTDHTPIQHLYHVDLYRLEQSLEGEMKNLGIGDLWGRPENVFVIEWSEKIAEALPNDAIYISLEPHESDARKITLKNTFV